MRKDCKRELNKLDVHYRKLLRAKQKILKGMEGNYKEEYAYIKGYAKYLQSVNPNNTIKVEVARRNTAPGRPLTFERMYFCFDAVEKSWKKGCRPIIGMDGCHLKGICKGQVLVAVGRDGNDGVYPIAWAVVDTESFESWSWFFKLVVDDLDLGDGESLTIVSDRRAVNVCLFNFLIVKF